MFGNRKKIIEEQNRKIIEQLSEKRENFDTGVAEMSETEKRIHTDLSQVLENTNRLIGHATTNVEEENGLICSMDEFFEEFQNALAGYQTICKMAQKQLEDMTNLVEENKHVTSPAKYLQEVSGTMKMEVSSLCTQLTGMEEDGEKMRRLALNAAEEDYVIVLEQIGQMAANFAQQSHTMRMEIASSNERIAELEEVVGRLLQLVKESNKGATRILKKNRECCQKIETTGMRDFTEDIVVFRDKIVGMRNLDEEIAKCAERDKIQLNDVQEDVAKQKEQFMELESDLSYMMDLMEGASGK